MRVDGGRELKIIKSQWGKESIKIMTKQKESVCKEGSEEEKREKSEFTMCVIENLMY